MVFKKTSFRLIFFSTLASASAYKFITSGIDPAGALALSMGMGALASSLFSQQPSLRTFSAFSGLVSAGASLFTNAQISLLPMALKVMCAAWKSCNFAQKEAENMASEHMALAAPLSLGYILGGLKIKDVNVRQRIWQLQWKLEEIRQNKENPSEAWLTEINIIIQMLPDFEKLLTEIKKQNASEAISLNCLLEDEIFQFFLFSIWNFIEERSQMNPQVDLDYILEGNEAAIDSLLLGMKMQTKTIESSALCATHQKQFAKEQQVICEILRGIKANPESALEACQNKAFQSWVAHTAFDLRAQNATKHRP